MALWRPGGTESMTRPARISAYLKVFNDWDFLPAMLRSISPLVDELIVVDGAYAWMADHLEQIGVDPLRSDSRVYDAIETSRIPYRVISKLWRGEAEARMAGYVACSCRHVLRIDADEVAFLDSRVLEGFLSREEAVGLVDTPSWIVPGWVQGRTKVPRDVSRGKAELPRLSLLFDSKQVSASIHLNYLWLMLGGGERRPEAGKRPFGFGPRSLGCIAHLQTWRPMRASADRAKFYVLKKSRSHGIEWLNELRGRKISDVNEVFKFVRPDAFRDVLNATRHGAQRLYADNLVVVPSPLSVDQEATFSDNYVAMIDDLAAFNRSLTSTGLHFATDLPFSIDLTGPDCTNAVVKEQTLRLEFDCEVAGAGAVLNELHAAAPYFSASPLPTRINGRRLTVEFLSSECDRAYLRRQVQISVKTDSPGAVRHFVIH